MATSPLFGWEEPDDTDLVKDGAAAIRTLGNAIDTSMGDLLGGTSGQVLSKNSNTNMDFTWVTPDDANAIQNAIVDAKGDLIAATAADTPARLAVGTNGQVLTADSAEATGLKWAAPAVSGFVGVSVYGGTLSLTSGSSTVVPFNNENFDTDSFHDNVTNNSRITIPTGKTGYYQVNLAGGTFQPNATGERYFEIYKNGSRIMETPSIYGSSGSYISPGAAYIFYFTAGDYIQLYATQTSGSTISLYSLSTNSNFSFQYLGA